MSTTAVRPRIRKSDRFTAALDALYDTPGLTRQELGLTPSHVSELSQGDKPSVKVVGKVETGKRGRPAHKLALTKSARDKIRKARARAEK